MIKIWQFKKIIIIWQLLSHFPRKKTCVQFVAPSFWLPTGEMSPQKKEKEKKKPSLPCKKRDILFLLLIKNIYENLYKLYFMKEPFLFSPKVSILAKLWKVFNHKFTDFPKI